MTAAFRRFFSSRFRLDQIVIGWTIATTILIFAYCAVAYQILGDRAFGSFQKFLELWNRWDAAHYQELAQSGYQATSQIRTWFYPMLPWVIRGVAWVVRDYLASAFVVAGISSMVAAVLLRRLVELDFSRAVALRSVWFFLIFPTAFFLHIGYTESLFLSFALGCFLAARKQCWWLAGLLGGLGAMTRPFGIIFIPALAVEAAHQMFLEKRWRWSWLWIGLVPLGFGVYLLINWQVLGDPFAFVQLRKELFYSTTTWPWTGVGTIVRSLRGPPGYVQTWMEELVFTALGLIGTVFCWFKLRPSYSVWMSGIWLIATASTVVQSMPRYTITMFPLFILFALAAANRFWNGVITVWSILFLALFSSLFAVGHWAF